MLGVVSRHTLQRANHTIHMDLHLNSIGLDTQYLAMISTKEAKLS